ncbi:MAG: ASKHA domain-containing protein [Candidatus Methanofastidiosia archaeon]
MALLYKIVFEPSGKKIKVKKGTTLLDAANKAGVGIEAICGGKGTCGKCKVYLKNGSLDDVTLNERKKLSEEEISNGARLACQAVITNHCIIDVPEESMIGKQKILVDGVDFSLAFDPLVRAFSIRLSPPTLEDNRSDWSRLADELEKTSGFKDIEVYVETLRVLPNILRDHNYAISVTLFKNRVIGISSFDEKKTYGVAVDIGTTTMVAYLVDLTDGNVVGIGSIMNPQIPYGDDVMARISYSFKHENLKKLSDIVVWGVNQIISNACEEAGVDIAKISEVVVVGNTAMHHIFLGMYPKYLSLAPYCPVIQEALDIQARDVGLLTNPLGNCHVLPVVAGFVGADHLGVILSCDIHKKPEMTLAIDVGTNGEIVLGNRDGMMCCSAAAGPALEGSHIKFGMRAADGAIEKVKIKHGRLDVKYKTIGNAKPLGICGSGIIDIVAEMLKTAVIDVTGRIRDEVDNDRIREGDRGDEFVIEWARKTNIKKDIVITSSDIREIQLAKSAIYSGVSILMDKRGITAKDIDRVLIAGAFGNYIDVENAMTIGLFPEVPLEKIKSVGNAAGTGARVSLMSQAKRKEENEILKKLKYVELATEDSFQEEFVAAMNFPHSDLSLFSHTMKKIYAPIPSNFGR